jgi:glutathionyl-hydroquinone reductase
MTAPVLWDKASRPIVSNMFSEILRAREVAL